MSTILENKVLKTIVAIFEWIICGILVLLILLTGFQKFSNQGSFFGYRIYTIASGSMIPTYNIGDTLLIQEMPASEIYVGDAVTFITDKVGKDGMIITHQVMKVDVDENGKYFFHTKGVANNVEDPIVYEDQVLGKVVHKFFFLSFLGRMTTNMFLTFFCIILPIALVAGIELYKALKDKDSDEDEEEEEQEYIISVGPEEENDESVDRFQDEEQDEDVVDEIDEHDTSEKEDVESESVEEELLANKVEQSEKTIEDEVQELKQYVQKKKKKKNGYKNNNSNNYYYKKKKNNQ